MALKAEMQGRIRILAEGDPIIDAIIANNPVLKAVHGSANGRIAVMDAMSIGQDGHPTVPAGVRDEIGDGPWVFDKDVVAAALPTFFGKPVVVDGSGFNGHEGARLTIGSIVGAEIYTDERGEFVRVFPVLWDLEYPEIVDEIKASRDGLSTSFEISAAQNQIEIVGGKGGTVKPKSFTFSASCVLKRENAAYPAQNVSAVAKDATTDGHSSEAVKEKSFYEIGKMVSKAIGEDGYIAEMFPNNVIYQSMKDGKHYKATYAMDGDVVTLGKPVEVKPTYVMATNDLPHLRNAMARLSKSDLSASEKKTALAHLKRHAKTLKVSVNAQEMTGVSPDALSQSRDRKQNLLSKGGKQMLENIPEELRDEVSALIETAKAEVVASFEAKLKEKETQIEAQAKSAETTSKDVKELRAELNAAKKFETVKASYPAAKHAEMLEVLKKVELGVATSDDVMLLATEKVVEKTTLTMGSGSNNTGYAGSKYSAAEIDKRYGIRARKTA